MQSILEWLNSNAGALGAVSGLIAAIATVVVVGYTRSTQLLFKLEIKKEEAAQRQLGAQLARSIVRIARLRMWVDGLLQRESGLGGRLGDDFLAQYQANLRSVYGDAVTLFDAAAAINPRAVHHLHFALLSLDLAQDSFTGVLLIPVPEISVSSVQSVRDNLGNGAAALLAAFEEIEENPELFGPMYDFVKDFRAGADHAKATLPPSPATRDRFAWFKRPSGGELSES